MNAYEQALAWNLVGTDAEIVAQLKATGVTYRPIDRATLVHIMNLRGMLTKVIAVQSDEKWTGTVLNMLEALIQSGQNQKVAQFRVWLSHITNPTNLKWDTTLPMYSADCWALYTVFADLPGMPTSQDFAALADLGGGWRFATLTEQEYAAQKQEALDRLAKISLMSFADSWLSQKEERAYNVKLQIENNLLTTEQEVQTALDA